MTALDRTLPAAQGMPEVILIAAVGPGGVIGDGAKLPWRLPRDMRLFRRLTIGQTVVMGRRTFDSLGQRPLPRRRNVVVTRNPGFAATGVEVAHSVPAALRRAGEGERVFVIGGGEIYREALPFASAILLTEIFDSNPNQNLFEAFRGDVFFPPLDAAEWQEARASRRAYVASDAIGLLEEPKRKGLHFTVRRFLPAGQSASRYPRLTAKELERHLATNKTPRPSPPDADQRDLFATSRS